jgi:hypothetical protein
VPHIDNTWLHIFLHVPVTHFCLIRQGVAPASWVKKIWRLAFTHFCTILILCCPCVGVAPASCFSSHTSDTLALHRLRHFLVPFMASSIFLRLWLKGALPRKKNRRLFRRTTLGDDIRWPPVPPARGVAYRPISSWGGVAPASWLRDDVSISWLYHIYFRHQVNPLTQKIIQIEFPK